MSALAPLLDKIYALADKELSDATSLPPEAYHSDALLRREIDALFYQDWICAGRADEIPHPYDYMSFDICDQPLILIRGEDGGIRALSNLCRHRMMRLVTGSGNAKSFTCPYHAWCYHHDGHLISAPHMDKTACFEKKDLALPVVKCEIYEGWIYVSLGADTPPVSDCLAALTPLIAPYQMAAYQTIFQETHLWDCNWKSLTENFMESYHLPVAHQQTVGADIVLDETSFARDVTSPHFTYQYFTKAEGAFVGTAHPDNTHLTGQARQRSVMPTIFPSHMYVLAPDHLWYLSLQPRGTGQVEIKYGAALAPEVLAASTDPERLIVDVKSFLDKVQEEDRFVVESISQGARAPLAQQGPLSWLEAEAHDFTRYLARRL